MYKITTINPELLVQKDYFQHIEDFSGNTFLSSVKCTHISIKKHCSSLNFFAGRSPLVRNCADANAAGFCNLRSCK